MQGVMQGLEKAHGEGAGAKRRVSAAEIAVARRGAFRPSALAASPVRVCVRTACVLVRMLARACANPPAKLGEV